VLARGIVEGPRVAAFARRASRLRLRLHDDEGAESGYTLIELMVVLLVAAIIMAIAIPTFFGVRTGAQDRAAQSNLVNAAIAAKTIFTTDGSFASLNGSVSEIASEEPELAFNQNRVWSTDPPNEVDVEVSADNNVLVLVDESTTGRCWLIEVNEEPIANASVPMWWTPSQGLSYGATVASMGVQTFCRASPPTLNPPHFTGWQSAFPN
jgi:type IV pilus assembly protein PilA